uniref:Nuclear protein, ataxia-telangiectasia locus n=1 Tax=Astyanax mexicanus TaxID=7994 RepID=A0A3B1JFR7_ASTMX
MLLPSDVARLVLGYLQQEGLSSTSRAFILESPNLREYAEHSSDDGAIPACVFSLFGKNLTTILNEYVAARAKETCQENQIPAMMTSLWKKLDFTLNQIKSMQNSPAVQQIQRLRTQNSIQNRRCQRNLSTSQTSSTEGLSVSTPRNCVASPIAAPQGMLGHSTPVCYTSQQTRPSTISLSQPGDSTLQIILPDQRFTPGPLSPARRKCDSPRRRGGGQSGTSRSSAVPSTLSVETQSQEAVTENLSQMVIENAREKILNDRSLQEKLAENINKILASSDNSPQVSKAACSAVEQEQSIDEILGLQGEIHMTDDAIQDILEHTESDPAFQALFDLFDYGKTKTAEDSEPAGESFSNSTQESDETGHADSATDTGTGHEDSTSGTETTTRKLRSKNVPDSKNKKKSSVSPNTGRLATASQSRSLRKRTEATKGSTPAKKGTSKSKVSVCDKQTRPSCSKSKRQLNNKADIQSTSSASLSEEGTSMVIDEQSDEMSETLSPQKVFQPVLQESSSINSKATNVKTSKGTSASSIHAKPTPGVAAEAEKQGTALLSAKQNCSTPVAPKISGQSTVESLLHKQTHNTDVLNKISSQQPATNKVFLPATEGNDTGLKQTMLSTSKGINPPSAATPTPSATACVPQSQTTAEPDPNKIVALKIIISDEQEEQNNESALNQAVSSISEERIPTIFLSSPAKSPAKVLSAPTSSITPEETAQAVSSLQGVDATGAPILSIQNAPQPSPARPLSVAGQETGFIQLLSTNTAIGGQSSFFVVTDPTVAQGSASSASQLVATPPRSRAVVTMAANVSQTFSPASAIIISSPVQPVLQNMAVPVSVFGQSNTGNVTVLPNQMLALPGPTLVNQPARCVAKPKLMPKDSADLGKNGKHGSNQVSNSSQSSEQVKTASGASPSHRRILCFDETTGQANTASTCASSGVQDRSRTGQIQPCSLASSGAQKRDSSGTRDSQKAVVHQQQKEHKKSMQNEINTNQAAGVSISPNNSTQQDLQSQLVSNREANLTVSQDTSQSLKCTTQPTSHKPTTVRKDTSQKESLQVTPQKSPEEPPKNSTSQDSPGITANKENEVDGDQRQLAAPSAPTARPSTPVSQSMSNKPSSKTSPLTKQAIEMLQDIQSQSPTATTPRRKGTGCLDLPLPRTPGSGRLQEDFMEGLRTPSRQRLGRDAEGTPRQLAPPATPDIPSCSPASEAGSENSINMAAHTLMILSRAARTGGPLKDSLRQEEAGLAKTSASKGKKRKHTEPSPSAKKELQLSGSSGSKKKSKKQKKLLDSFPHDLDVDKFLSSLHYDE